MARVKLAMKRRLAAVQLKKAKRTSKIKVEAKSAKKSARLPGGLLRKSSRTRKVVQHFVSEPITTLGKTKKLTSKKEITKKSKTSRIKVLARMSTKKTVSKRVKAADTSRKRKATKEPKIRKVGNDKLVPRPEVTVPKENPFLYGQQQPDFVSSRSYHRLLIRAVARKDLKEIKSIIGNKKRFACNMADRSFSHGFKQTASSLAVLTQDPKVIEMLFTEKKKAVNEGRNNVKEEINLLQKKSAGRANFYMLGRGTRAIEATRGGREGNNALLNYEFEENHGLDDHVLTKLIQSNVEYATLHKLIKLEVINSHSLLEKVIVAVRMGHRTLASQLVEAHGQDNFNKLHLHTLKFSSTQSLGKILPVSVRKRGYGVSFVDRAFGIISVDHNIIAYLQNRGITPIHTAAIHASANHLKKLQEIEPVINQPDGDNWYTIHYAAVSEGSETLQYLLSKNTSPTVINKHNETPLHCAARAGRVDNVKILLKAMKTAENITEKDDEGDGEEDDDVEPAPKKAKATGTQSLVNAKTRSGETALHYAARFGHREVVKALLADPSIIVDVPNGPNQKKLTPLMVACEEGHLDVANDLIDIGKALVNSKDKLKRTPLIHAVLNGQEHVVAMLLRRGADINMADSSSNSPAHYAAAYGWLEILKILAKVDSNCLAAANDWLLTPLSVSYLKGHTGIAEWLLDGKHEQVDVNCKDNEGVTLIASLLKFCDESSALYLPEQLKYLIDKGADCSVVDGCGNGPLHVFASLKLKLRVEGKDGEAITKNDFRLTESDYQKCFEALLKAKADPVLKNMEGQTAFQCALNAGNLLVAEWLFGKTGDKRIYFDGKWAEDDTTPLYDLLKLPFEVYNGSNHATPRGPLPYQYDISNLLKALIKVDKEVVRIWLQTPKKNADKTKTLDTPLIQFLHQYNNFSVNTNNGQQFMEKMDQIIEVLLDLNPSAVLQSLSKENAEAINEGINVHNQQRTRWPHNESARPTVEAGSVLHYAVRGCKAFPDTDLLEIILKGAQKGGHLEEALSLRDPKDRTPLLAAIDDSRLDAALAILRFVSKLPIATKISAARITKKWNDQVKQDEVVNVTALMLAVDRELFPVIQELKLNAEDWSAVDAFGANAFHYAARRNSPNTVKLFDMLDEKGVRIVPNAKGQMPLHLAVNADETGSADVDLAPVEWLLKKQDPNIADTFQRTALHYAFLKTLEGVSAIDPIAVVSLLVNTMSKQGITQIDHRQASALHYAAARDANISTVTLLRHGCRVDEKNEDGNTPLGLAVLHRRQAVALTLIQAGGDVTQEVYGPEPKKGKNEKNEAWKLLASKESDEQRLVASVVSLVVRNEWHGLIYIIIELLKKTPQTVAQLVRAALEHRQYHFSFTLLKLLESTLGFAKGKDAKKAAMDEVCREELFLTFAKKLHYNDNEMHAACNASSVDNSLDPPPTVAFTYPTATGRTTVPLTFAPGVPVPPPEFLARLVQHIHNIRFPRKLQPIRARKEKKVAPRRPELLQAFTQEVSSKVLDNLFRLRVPWLDANGSSRVIETLAENAQFAAMKQIRALDQELDNGAGWRNLKGTKKGRSPLRGLIIYWATKMARRRLQDDSDQERLLLQQWVRELGQTFGLDALIEVEKPAMEGLFTPLPDRYKPETELIPPISLAIRYGALDLVYFLIKEGANVNTIDQQSRTPLMHALAMNDKEAVALLFNPDFNLDWGLEKDKKQENLKNTARNQPIFRAIGVSNGFNNGNDSSDEEEEDDDEGSDDGTSNSSDAENMSENREPTPVPEDPKKKKKPFTFEHKNKGLNLDASDCSGKVSAKPGENVLQNWANYLVEPVGWENLELLKALERALGPNLKKALEKGNVRATAARLGQRRILKEFNRILGGNVEAPKEKLNVSGLGCPYDVAKDSEEWMHREKLAQKDKEMEKKNVLKPHTLTGYEKIGTIEVDENGQPYKILLNKTDLRYGTYGFHNFYRMELVKRNDSNLWVMFTNWGRIGDGQGQHQITPFGSRQEAVTEFGKVYRSKTGQNWGPLEEFAEIKDKYRLVKTDDSPAAHVFNFELKVDKEEKEPVYAMLRDLSNPQKLKSYAEMVRINRSEARCPFGKVPQEKIDRAREVLDELNNVHAKVKTLHKKKNMDSTELLRLMEKQMLLSNEFYQCLPLGDFEYGSIPVLDNDNLLKEAAETLDKLQEVQITARVLSAASLNATRIDSINAALECKIEALQETDLMSQRIIQAAHGGTIHRVFKLLPKIPAENFEQFAADTNQRYLWHGTKPENLLSILHMGLRSVPAHALHCGQAFGKGVYLADTFEKSQNYCTSSGDGYKYMLLSKVALGKVSENQEEDCSRYDTLFVKGRRAPQPRYDISIDGAVLSLGQVNFHRLTDSYVELNEFVVVNEKRVLPAFLVLFK